MKSETPFVGRSTTRQVVSNALAGCSRLLHERIILVLALMFCAGVAGVLWRVSRVQSNLIAAIALQNASLYTQALTEFRTLYTSEVVQTVTGHGIEVTHDYATKAGAIPLPVTLSMLLGQRLGARESGAQSRLYSPYPFPWRQQESGLQDAFAEEAWNALQHNPHKPFYRFEDIQGRRSLRYATADLMRPSCVNCHNTHPASPKIDWQPGQVRGVLEIIFPLEAAVAQTRAGLRGTFALIVVMSVLGLSGMALVIGRLQRSSADLQQRAHDLQSEITVRTRAEQALAARVQQVEALRAVTAEITRELEPTALLGLITQRAVDLVEAATSGAVYLWDETTEVLVPRAWHGRGEWMQEVRFRLGEGLVGGVAQRREGLLVNDYQTSPYATPVLAERLGFTAIVAEPLLYRDRLVGVIAISNEGTGRSFTAQDSDLLALFAAEAAIAIDNARLYEEVRGTRDFLQSIAENSVDAIVTTDVSGRVTYWSPGAEELLGYRAKEAFGLTAAGFYRGGLEEARAIMQQLRTDGRIGNYETALRTKNGRWVEVSSSLSLLRDTSGARIGTLAVIKDMTEHKRAEAALRQAKEAAEAANHAKSAFLDNMRHELRTPLNAIMGYSEMLQEEAEDLGQADFIPDLQSIRTAGKNLLTLINDILDFSKIEAGKMDLSLETFTIAMLVQEVVTTIQPLAEQNHNALVVHCADNLGTMLADLTKVRQSLLNLLSNACKFTEQGSITLEVIREAVDTAAWITFRVADTGIGMTSEQMQKLFQPFVQVDASATRAHGGAGLGLAISQRFCQMMGGTIAVESALGVGSTFTMRLPNRPSAVSKR
jgi:PAS domain S-box-containing protein